MILVFRDSIISEDSISSCFIDASAARNARLFIEIKRASAEIVFIIYAPQRNNASESKSIPVTIYTAKCELDARNRYLIEMLIEALLLWQYAMP